MLSVLYLHCLVKKSAHRVKVGCRMWHTATQDQSRDDMDGKITKRQMALGVSMVYGGLVAAMAALNYTDVMLIVVLVGGPVVAWAWSVASRDK